MALGLFLLDCPADHLHRLRGRPESRTRCHVAPLRTAPRQIKIVPGPSAPLADVGDAIHCRAEISSFCVMVGGPSWLHMRGLQYHLIAVFCAFLRVSTSHGFRPVLSPVGWKYLLEVSHSDDEGQAAHLPPQVPYSMAPSPPAFHGRYMNIFHISHEIISLDF